MLLDNDIFTALLLQHLVIAVIGREMEKGDLHLIFHAANRALNVIFNDRLLD